MAKGQIPEMGMGMVELIITVATIAVFVGVIMFLISGGGK
jgi:hypothetical protein